MNLHTPAPREMYLNMLVAKFTLNINFARNNLMLMNVNYVSKILKVTMNT